MAVAVLCMVATACTGPGNNASDSAVPTVAVDAADAMCGLDPASIRTVTGVAGSTVKDDFTGSGDDLRGTCEVISAGSTAATAWVAVNDAESDNCTTARDIVEGRSDWPEVVDFTRLDGGAWSRVRTSDDDLGKGTSSVAFLGDLCVRVALGSGVEGRAPVPDIEALTQQAIATLGLDPSSS